MVALCKTGWLQGCRWSGADAEQMWMAGLGKGTLWDERLGLLGTTRRCWLCCLIPAQSIFYPVPHQGRLGYCSSSTGLLFSFCPRSSLSSDYCHPQEVLEREMFRAPLILSLTQWWSWQDIHFPRNRAAEERQVQQEQWDKHRHCHQNLDF